jgi:hypothetical protein
MWERVKVTLGRYADPRYLWWLLLLLGLVALILGAGAPDACGPISCKGG